MQAVDILLVLAALCCSAAGQGGSQLQQPPAQQQQQQQEGQAQSPFSLVARQLVEEECPDMDAQVFESWSSLQAYFFEAHATLFGPEDAAPWLGLEMLFQGLAALMDDLSVAYQCPVSCAQHFRKASEWAMLLGHPRRARALVQIGNAFKLQALGRWWSNLGPDASSSQKKFHPRMQVEFTLTLNQLQGALQVPLRPLRRYAAAWKPKIEVHSICTYRPDPTSNTGPECPLTGLSVPNHRAYSDRYGYKYVLHTELPLPDREAHYSKMLVIHEALRSERLPDWVLFIDCDAFFTNADFKVEDVLETYGAGEPNGPHFLVAEDPGGINTGILLFRRSSWSTEYLERVAASSFGIAWDQTMFFWEILRASLFDLSARTSSGQPADLVLPSQVAFVHQAHLNAFVPPASHDWSAYEWQPGDFIRHFAGCPWQEQHCLGLMQETAEYAKQQLLTLSR